MEENKTTNNACVCERPDNADTKRSESGSCPLNKKWSCPMVKFVKRVFGKKDGKK